MDKPSRTDRLAGAAGVSVCDVAEGHRENGIEGPKSLRLRFRRRRLEFVTGRVELRRRPDRATPLRRNRRRVATRPRPGIATSALFPPFHGSPEPKRFRPGFDDV